MSDIVERYNGYIGISGAWLIELIGKCNVEKAQQRGHILMLRRGGNGRTALVDWGSMGSKMKARVMDALGCDPAKVDEKSLLREMLEKREAGLMDMGAYEYFSKVKDVSGHYLKPEKVEELWNGAKVLGAIGEVLEVKRKAATMRKLRLSEAREFAALAKDDASKELVDLVMSLLARDQKGNLKASRVIKLEQIAEKSDSEEFKEGIRIIREAYRPTRSKLYIRASEKVKKETGESEWEDIALGLTEV